LISTLSNCLYTFSSSHIGSVLIAYNGQGFMQVGK
jgi:hypothetical protein